MNHAIRDLPHAATPLADALSSLAQSQINSFHTLPLSRGRSIRQSSLRAAYDRLFGHYPDADLTVTGDHFDTFFFGKQVINEAEQLAAGVFGADGTLFITSGTTVSNQVALDALYQPGTRVLLDKTCHQSMHFGLHRHGAEIDYLTPAWTCDQSEQCMWSAADLLDKALHAQSSGRPYSLIVLNAHSYDGIVYDIPGVLAYLLGNGVTTMHYLIDEAWGAANYFQAQLRNLTAMQARSLRADWPALNVVATHSAHKSMSCLRQASMIHYCGDAALGARLKVSRFRLHTTSPSYPILASLDLARAQMQEEGASLLASVSSLADTFRNDIARIFGPDAVNQARFSPAAFPFAHTDPTKVSVNIDSLGMPARDIKEILFTDFGVYVNRITEHALLFNFHIGIDRAAAQAVIDALAELAARPRLIPGLACSKNFIIPYPPGVPLVVPGQEITPAIQRQIQAIQRNGIHVFYA